MGTFWRRAPLLAELFVNGIFLLCYSMLRFERLPELMSREMGEKLVLYSVWLVPFVLFFVIVSNMIYLKSFSVFLRRNVFSLIIFVPLLITWGDIEFTFLLAAIHLFSSILSLYETNPGESGKKEFFDFSFLLRYQLKPAQFVTLTFIALILLGAFVLALPFSAKSGQSIGLIDAFFMATSAVCVTGLATIDISQSLSIVGQVVILLLVQIGALGYMTLSSSLTILLGRSMGLKQKFVMQDLLDISSLEDLITFVVDIIKYTLIIELWGGILLSIAFSWEGFELGEALFLGFFHSVSAFCNAGFALFSTSLEGYATNPLINAVVCTLITLGGIGFIVLKELKSFIQERRNIINLSLHTKIVLSTSAFLILSGFLAIFFGEFLHSLDGYGLFDKVQIALFQSITTRSSGFNTIALNSFHAYTVYILTLFMLIGASPGSVGGGIKTTTFAILVQSIRATLKGEDSVRLFNRKIPNVLVVKSTALSIISVIFVSFFLLIMMKIEGRQGLLELWFEVVSAFSTVGLSLGITASLSALGKVAITLLMFIGRVGPLTLVLAIGQNMSGSQRVGYPEGRVMIG